MATRAVIVEAFRHYYADRHISVGAGFACPHRNTCESLASPRPLQKGMEAHVGHRYGEGRRIAVVSLDSGNSSEGLDRRTETVEPITPENAGNPHMRGTARFVRLLVDSEHPPKLPMSFAAMLNSAKCAGGDASMSTVPRGVHEQCRAYLIEELHILEPTLIWLQGTMVRELLTAQLVRLENIDSKLLGYLGLQQPVNSRLEIQLEPVVNEYLRLFRSIARDGGEQQIVTVLTPHPSDRYGRWALFERALMPLVAGLAGVIADISPKI